MNFLINFNDNTKSLDASNFMHLRRWIIDTVKNEGYRMGDLSFDFCSDSELYNLNIEFLDHNTYTDVITFDYSQSGFISGEIYISIDRVRENAFSRSQLFFDELDRVIIHGVLHLMGYKDKTKKEKELMSSKEDYYLSLRSESKN